MWLELLTHPWWTWNPETATRWELVYRGFNVCEALTWFSLAVLVACRWTRHRKSPLELPYALAFATFGLSDLREAGSISATLVLAKAVNLGALLWLRRYVMRSWYPDSRLY